MIRLRPLGQTIATGYVYVLFTLIVLIAALLPLHTYVCATLRLQWLG